MIVKDGRGDASPVEGLALEKIEVRVLESAKIQRLLYSKIYTDVKQAAVREILQNALDESNKVDIMLPSIDLPIFSIRDYGPGMSPEFIRKNFSTMGFSSKEHGNDKVGFMGIGSKAPFAYTDSFNITSHFQNTAYFYILNLTDDGAQIVLSNTQPTASTGVEVSWKVNDEDMDEFKTALGQVLYYIPTKFEIEVRADARGLMSAQGPSEGAIITRSFPRLSDHSCSHKGNGWKIMSYPRDRDGSSIVTMGRIGYRTTPEVLNGLSAMARNLLRMPGIVLEFDNGDLVPNPNRETLNYNDVTKKAVVDRAELMVKELLGQMQAKIDAEPTKWDGARVIIDMLERSYSFVNCGRNIHTTMQEHFNWRGQPFPIYNLNSYNLASTLGVDSDKVKHLPARLLHGELTDSFNVKANKMRGFIESYPRFGSNQTIFAVINGVKNPARRLKFNFDKYMPKSSLTQPHISSVIILDNDEQKAKIQAALPEFPDIYFVDVSLLPVEPPMPKISRPRKTKAERTLEFLKYNDSTNILTANLTESQMGVSTYYYLEFVRKEMQPTNINGRQIQIFSNFPAAYEEAKTLGIIGDKDFIYGVPNKINHKISTRSNWVDLGKLVHSKRQAFYDENKVWIEFARAEIGKGSYSWRGQAKTILHRLLAMFKDELQDIHAREGVVSTKFDLGSITRDQALVLPREKVFDSSGFGKETTMNERGLVALKKYEDLMAEVLDRLPALAAIVPLMADDDSEYSDPFKRLDKAVIVAMSKKLKK